MAKLYLDSGYINWDYIIDEINVPFTFVFGARGVGKTYGILEKVYKEKLPFLFTRRTQVEMEMLNKPDFFPFKSVLNNHPEWHIGIGSLTKYNAGFYAQEEGADGKWVNAGAPIGYTGALSTFYNLRGFDASDVKIWIYDEFIPETHARPIKEEGKAFLNIYETVNRNRELSGADPLRCVCCANANSLANPVFIELGIVRNAQIMKKKQRNIYVDDKRGICLIDPWDSPISGAKMETALYKVANRNSDFYHMAIENRFSDLDAASTASKDLRQYNPIVRYGELTIYKHKSERLFYVTTHNTGSPPQFNLSEIDKARFWREYSWIWEQYLNNQLDFEDYSCEALFNKYIKS